MRVPGDGLTEHLGQGPHGLTHGCFDRLGPVVWGEVKQQDEPGGALDQGPDGGAIHCPQDEIALPVPGHRPVGHFGRAF